MGYMGDTCYMGYSHPIPYFASARSRLSLRAPSLSRPPPLSSYLFIGTHTYIQKSSWYVVFPGQGWRCSIPRTRKLPCGVHWHSRPGRGNDRLRRVYARTRWSTMYPCCLREGERFLVGFEGQNHDAHFCGESLARPTVAPRRTRRHPVLFSHRNMMGLLSRALHSYSATRVRPAGFWNQACYCDEGHR